MQTILIKRSPPTLPRSVRALLPGGLCDAILHCGAPVIEEIRLHGNRYICVSGGRKNYVTSFLVPMNELAEILKRMCQGSLYAYSRTINQGYLTLSDGVRVGICGSAAIENGNIIGVSDISSLILRIPHSRRVEHSEIITRFFSRSHPGGILLYSPPGIGKTTLLRALARTLSSPPHSLRTVVVDSREELCFDLEGNDLNLDILSGYPRKEGIEIAVRSLGAQVILCDEIGNPEEARAILGAANAGVPLIASAHAKEIWELLSRPSFRQLHTMHVFDCYVGLERKGDGEFFYQFYDWQSLGRVPASYGVRT